MLRKRDGQTIGYSYDALNRMTVKDIPAGTSADVHYGYDARGQQLFARFGSASGQGVSNTWDGFGQQRTSSTNMGGTTRTLQYEWTTDTLPGTGGSAMWDGKAREICLLRFDGKWSVTHEPSSSGYSARQVQTRA